MTNQANSLASQLLAEPDKADSVGGGGGGGGEGGGGGGDDLTSPSAGGDHPSTAPW